MSDSLHGSQPFRPTTRRDSQQTFLRAGRRCQERPHLTASTAQLRCRLWNECTIAASTVTIHVALNRRRERKPGLHSRKHRETPVLLVRSAVRTITCRASLALGDHSRSRGSPNAAPSKPRYCRRLHCSVCWPTQTARPLLYLKTSGATPTSADRVPSQVAHATAHSPELIDLRDSVGDTEPLTGSIEAAETKTDESFPPRDSAFAHLKNSRRSHRAARDRKSPVRSRESATS